MSDVGVGLRRGIRQSSLENYHYVRVGTLSLGATRTLPADFFSTLLGFLPEEERSIQPGDGDGDELDRQQQSAHDGI